VVLTAVVVILSLPIVVAGDANLGNSGGGQEVSEPMHYFVQLLGTREGWPDNMSAEEEKIMSEHFVYLKGMVFKKKVLMAGPCFDPVFGLIVLQVDSESEGREIIDNDPSIKSGLMTYKMQPFHLSLMAEHVPKDRYVTNPSDRILRKEVTVQATLDEVWNAWTTDEGVRNFFSENTNVELRVGGPYEIYFSMQPPVGMRGSEGCRILSFLPKAMLSFEWSAPPSFGELRKQHTQVILQFDEASVGLVKVTFAQLGWGKGEEWDKLYDYFDHAWSSVLGAFEERCVGGG